MRLLLVEDDQSLSGALKRDLERAGFAVDLAEDGVTAQRFGEREPYDVVVLDLGLPQRSGMEVLQQWRKKGNKVPVLVLTARDTWQEKVDGFKAGADDYLAKPFHIEELLVRINAVMRRSKQQVGGALAVGGLTLDEERQCVSVDGGAPIELTGIEFRLLRYFMLHPGRIVSKGQIMEHVYDYDSDKESNVIEVYIKRLRQKLGRDCIETRRGQGYVLREGGA